MDREEVAHSVAKGLKKKEVDDISYKVGVFFSIVSGIVAGIIFKSIFIGIIVFFIFGLIAWKRWYHG